MSSAYRTTEKQPTESGPYVKADGGKPSCFVCKKRIAVGQLFYRLKTGYLCRHADCARKLPRAEIPDPDEQIRRSQDRIPKGSAKRRRAAGHGYSGGDGFVDM